MSVLDTDTEVFVPLAEPEEVKQQSKPAELASLDNIGAFHDRVEEGSVDVETPKAERKLGNIGVLHDQVEEETEEVFVPMSDEDKKAYRVKALEDNWNNALAKTGKTPDQIADVERLAKANGWPEWMVEKNPQVARARAEMPDFDKLDEDHPHTANFLGNAGRMALSHDDLENLKLTEDVLNADPVRKFINSLAYGWTNNNNMQRFSELSSKARKDPNGLSEEEAAEFEETKANLTKKGFPTYKPVEGISSVASFFFRPIAKASPSLLTLLGGAAVASNLVDKSQGNSGAMLAGAGVGALATVPSLVTAITSTWAKAHMVDSSVKLGQEFLYKDLTEMKDEDGKLLSDTVGLETLGQIADWAGLISGMAEFIPMEYTARLLGGVAAGGAARSGLKALLAKPVTRQAIVGLVKGYAGGMAAEVGTEVLQKAIEQTGGEVFSELARGMGANIEDLTPQEQAAKFMEGLKTEAVEAAKSFSLAMAIGPVMNFHRDMNLVMQSQQQQLMFEQLAGAMADSKTRGRMPEATNDFVSQITQNGPLEYTYIDGEKFSAFLQENGIPLEQMAAEIGIKAEDITQAAEEQGKVAVSTGQYAAKIAGTDMGNALLGDVTFSEDGMTGNEAQIFQQEEKENMKREMEKAEIIMAGESARKNDLVYIKDSIMAMGLASNYPTDTTEGVASLWTARGNTVADRYGINPKDWFDNIQLQIKQNFGTPTPGALFQAVYHGSPFKFDKFTLKAMGTGEGAQAYGWGLYFAGQKAVAEEYREMAYDPDLIKLNGKPLNEAYDDLEKQASKVHPSKNQAIYEKMEALEKLMMHIHIDEIIADGEEEEWSKATMKWLKKDVKNNFETFGQLYQAEIPEDDVMLDWDKPFSEQPAIVQEKLKEIHDKAAEKKEANRAKHEARDIYYTDRARKSGIGKQEYTAFPKEEVTGKELYENMQDEIREERVKKDADWEGIDKEASLKLNEVGIRGIKYLDGDSRSKGEGSHNYVVFDDEAIEITKKYYQAQEKEVKGQTSIYDSGKVVIDLFKGADRSTLLHETGHVFLNDLYNTAKINEAAAEDFEAVKAWLEIDDWETLTPKQMTKAQETFARTFEVYLLDGRAPTTRLKRVFRAFKDWLTDIYKDMVHFSEVTGEDIDMNQETKDLFDRLLATDQQIDEVNAMADYNTAVEQSEESIQKHNEATDRAKEDADNNPTAAQLKARRKELNRRVRIEVENSQGYNALNSMRRSSVKGGIKINTNEIIELYGEEKYQNVIKKLRITTKTSSWKLDDIALSFGYTSGDEMMQDLMTLPDMRKAIKNQVDAMMKSEATIDQLEAQGLIRNEDQLEALSIERENINNMTPEEQERKAKGERTDFKKENNRNAIRDRVEAIKRIAHNAIARKKASTVKPAQYLAAERKAKLAVEKALKDNNFDEAKRQKDIQIINSALAGEASRVVKELDKIHTYLKKMAKVKYGKGAKVETAYADQIHALLDPLNLGPRSKKAEAEMSSFLLWKKEQEAQGNVITVPDRLMKKLGRTHYKDFTVEDLRDLRDSIKNLEHLGRFLKRMLTDKDKREFQDVVDSLVTQAREMVGVKHPVTLDPNVTKSEAMLNNLRGLNASMTRMEFLLRKLDGNKDMGLFWNTFFRPVVDSQNMEFVMKEDAMAHVGQLFEGIDVKNMSKLKFYPKMGLSLKKENVLAMALNMGNEGNYERLVLGHKLEQDQITEIMDSLNKEDWDFVQGVWDYINSYWPEIAKLEKRLTGVVPEKVEARPIKTKFGTYRGGYYPAVYNPLKSAKSFEHQEKKDTQDFMSNQYFRAQTKQGHTEARAGHGGRQLRLDLGVIGEHLSQVIHDLAFRETLIDLDRLNRSDELKEALGETVGREMQKQFKPWLQHIAGSGFTPVNNFEKILAHARKGVTIGVLGLKMTTITMQAMSIFGSEERLGQKRMLHSIYDFYHDPTKWKAKRDFVFSKSVEVRNRSRTFERDIRDTINKNIGAGKKGNMVSAFFYLHGMMDAAAVLPTWLEAYDKKLSESGNDEKAVYYADSVVRQTQPASNAKDMPDIMRGHESRKLFTMFYSYFSVFENLLGSRLGSTKGLNDVPQLIASVVWLVIVPSILGQLITRRGPTDDEDPFKWGAKTALLYPFNAIPVVRDVVSAASSGFGYNVTPAAQAFESAANLISSATKLINGDKEPVDMIKPLLRFGGYWGHFPVGQTEITVGKLLEYINGKDSDIDLRDLFLKKKE